MPREQAVPIWVPGVHAYAEKTVAAGETIHFRVSSDEQYRMSVVRLGSDPDSPARDIEVHHFAPAVAQQQPIFPGSYVNIEPPLPPYQPINAITLECWARPFALDNWQGVISQYTYPDACGIGLFIMPDGSVAVYLGDGGQFDSARLYTSQTALAANQWFHLVGVWDGTNVSLWINGAADSQHTLDGTLRPGTAPLRLGAYGENWETTYFLDGDLAMPIIYDRALSPEEIGARYQAQALKAPNLDDVSGCWPLREEQGDHIADISPYRRHGQIINHATWMIGGPGFDHSIVPRFGHYDPAEDTRRGHGLRLASDDLFDCNWGITHQYRIPEDSKPGIYVGRIRFGPNFGYLYDVTFVVRKALHRARAPILVLCSTNTWLAYNATAFAANNCSDQPLEYWGTSGRGEGDTNSHPDAPAFSCYRSHKKGQPTSQLGLRTPWPDAQPYVLYSPLEAGYSHLMRAERFAHIWLDENGYDYDVIGDFDLHRDPSILDGYQVLLINGHNEYWSIPAYKGLERFLHRGGNVIVLSGNTMFWRVSFDDDMNVMECRKLLGIPGGDSPIGEIFHSQDKLRGSLMRESGYPAYDLIGMESVGYWTSNQPLAYTCVQPDFFLFKHPEDVELEHGESFAEGSVGHEWDTRVSLPQMGNLPYAQSGMTVLGECWRVATDYLWDYFMRPLEGEAVTSEMIYWERPKGGRVFYAGSIGAGWGLMKDARWSAILRNVLHHFDVARSLRYK